MENVSEEERGEYSIKRLFTKELEHEIENVGFYRTLIPEGNKVAMHHHENLAEVLFFLTKGFVKTDEGEFELESGDSIFLEKGDNHEIVAREDEVRLIAVKLPNYVEDKQVTA